jgi:hypothetical protein
VSTPIDDPTANYTIPSLQPAGLRIPEFAIRTLISWAFDQVRGTINTPNDVVEQLFSLVPQAVRDQFKQWMLQNENMYIDVSWPRDSASLALVVVEPQSEAESTDVILNDHAGMVDHGTFGDVNPSAGAAYAIPEKRTTNIYVASDDDRLTLFLYELVKFILVSNKQLLTKFYDVNNLSLSGGVLDHDSEKLPQFVYYRVLQATYMTFFDWSGVPSAAAIVSLNLMVDTIQNAQRVVVPVPTT